MRTKGAKNKARFINIKLSVLNSILKENADIAVSKEFAESISKLIGGTIPSTEVISESTVTEENKASEEKITFTQIY